MTCSSAPATAVKNNAVIKAMIIIVFTDRLLLVSTFWILEHSSIRYAIAAHGCSGSQYATMRISQDSGYSGVFCKEGNNAGRVLYDGVEISLFQDRENPVNSPLVGAETRGFLCGKV
jgi:hypothetical protein